MKRETEKMVCVFLNDESLVPLQFTKKEGKKHINGMNRIRQGSRRI